MEKPSANIETSFDEPIVREVREAGDEMAREAGDDLHTLCERLQKAESEHTECLAAGIPAANRVRK